MSSADGRRLFWLLPLLAPALVALVLFGIRPSVPGAQRAAHQEKPPSSASRLESGSWRTPVVPNTAVFPNTAVAPNTALADAVYRRAPGDVSASDPAAEPAHGPHWGDDEDDEIALFESNLAQLNSSQHLLDHERAQSLFDQQETQRLNTELIELSRSFPFPAHVHVLCTASICDVQWQSAEALETLIPELAPWLITHANYAVAESAEPVGVGFDARRALRLLLPNAARVSLVN